MDLCPILLLTPLSLEPLEAELIRDWLRDPWLLLDLDLPRSGESAYSWGGRLLPELLILPYPMNAGLRCAVLYCCALISLYWSLIFFWVNEDRNAEVFVGSWFLYRNSSLLALCILYIISFYATRLSMESTRSLCLRMSTKLLLYLFFMPIALMFLLSSNEGASYLLMLIMLDPNLSIFKGLFTFGLHPISSSSSYEADRASPLTDLESAVRLVGVLLLSCTSNFVRIFC